MINLGPPHYWQGQIEFNPLQETIQVKRQQHQFGRSQVAREWRIDLKLQRFIYIPVNTSIEEMTRCRETSDRAGYEYAAREKAKRLVKALSPF